MPNWLAMRRASASGQACSSGWIRLRHSLRTTGAASCRSRRSRARRQCRGNRAIDAAAHRYDDTGSARTGHAFCHACAVICRSARSRPVEHQNGVDVVLGRAVARVRRRRRVIPARSREPRGWARAWGRRPCTLPAMPRYRAGRMHQQQVAFDIEDRLAWPGSRSWDGR